MDGSATSTCDVYAFETKVQVAIVYGTTRASHLTNEYLHTLSASMCSRLKLVVIGGGGLTRHWRNSHTCTPPPTVVGAREAFRHVRLARPMPRYMHVPTMRSLQIKATRAIYNVLYVAVQGVCGQPKRRTQVYT